ncbi:MAG: ferritin-like domain-containing protein [Rhodospirillaceae bacterium]|nr:ferritin-like domain-containing protein [Rhodospirillaceae bacterium]
MTELTASPADAAPVWRFAREGRIRPGSEVHKQLFCRMLLDTYDPYKPAVIPWPTLAPDALARLTGLPFWDIAVETELHTSKNMQVIADATKDPLIREAIALNAFEERRHKIVLENMIRFYGIEIEPDESFVPPPDPEWAYLCTGYGECFDSFFSFGLFKLAKDSGFFPPELIEVFEPVIQEEARHILFFVNWAVYAQAQRSLPLRPAFAGRRFAALASRAWKRMKFAKGDNLAGKPGEGSQEGKNNSAMTIEGRNFVSGGEKLTIKRFMKLCLAENDRRMARYDARLVRPLAMPRLIKAAMPFLGLVG